MLLKSAFPAEYEIFKQVVDNEDWAIHQTMTDKDIRKSFAYKSGKLKLFEPLTHDDYPSLQDGDNNRFDSKYYWYFCKALGCTIHFGDYLTPITIKKNNKIVGYAMGMATEELGHRKAA